MATFLLVRLTGAASTLLGASLLASSAVGAAGTAGQNATPAATPPPAATPAAPGSQAGTAPVPPVKSGSANKAIMDEVMPPAGVSDREPEWQREPATRRSGFTVGLAGGFSIGSSAGYPNNVQKIGFERYYTETGVGVGGGGYLWIGGALTDWFTFGVGACANSMTAGKYTAGMTGVIFHTEVFPLFSLGGLWREAGIVIDTGTGLASTTSEDTGDTKIIDGALPAKIGGGIFYEGFRLWKVSAGPWLYADYTWSASVRQPSFYLGLRTALYSGAAER